MVAIKDMEMPKGCQHCKFFRKLLFGNGLDYSYSCDRGATEFPYPWIRQMEERASDCLLVEIEERKVGKWIYDKTIQNWRCSECNETPKTLGYIGTADFMAEHFLFCNHCGAEMKW